MSVRGRPTASTTSGRSRLSGRQADVAIIQHASQLIADLGVQLDRMLEREHRQSERMRMLREATNRITRAANDAVMAYSRCSRALRAELARPDADVQTADAIRTRLDAARANVLHALDVASERYPPTPVPPVTPSTDHA